MRVHVDAVELGCVSPPCDSIRPCDLHANGIYRTEFGNLTSPYIPAARDSCRDGLHRRNAGTRSGVSLYAAHLTYGSVESGALCMGSRRHNSRPRRATAPTIRQCAASEWGPLYTGGSGVALGTQRNPRMKQRTKRALACAARASGHLFPRSSGCMSRWVTNSASYAVCPFITLLPSGRWTPNYSVILFKVAVAKFCLHCCCWLQCHSCIICGRGLRRFT
ncbi:hypothetical protein MRX96_010809 [Rhipicephalus microplus]